MKLSGTERTAHLDTGRQQSSRIWKVLDTAGKSGVRGEAGRMTAIRL